MHLCYFPIPEVIHQLWGISCIPIPEWSRSHWTTGNWNPACLIQQTIKLFILSCQQLLTPPLPRTHNSAVLRNKHSSKIIILNWNSYLRQRSTKQHRWWCHLVYRNCRTYHHRKVYLDWTFSDELSSSSVPNICHMIGHVTANFQWMKRNTMHPTYLKVSSSGVGETSEPPTWRVSSYG